MPRPRCELVKDLPLISNAKALPRKRNSANHMRSVDAFFFLSFDVVPLFIFPCPRSHLKHVAQSLFPVGSHSCFELSLTTHKRLIAIDWRKSERHQRSCHRQLLLINSKRSIFLFSNAAELFSRVSKRAIESNSWTTFGDIWFFVAGIANKPASAIRKKSSNCFRHRSLLLAQDVWREEEMRASFNSLTFFLSIRETMPPNQLDLACPCSGLVRVGSGMWLDIRRWSKRRIIVLSSAQLEHGVHK